MEAMAIARWIRLSPDKARLLARELQGKPVDQALKIARWAKVKAADPIRKCLESAIANAEHNYDMDVAALVVKACRIDRAPFIKRMQPRSRGRADVIQRRTCHITVVVSDETSPSLGEGEARSQSA